MLLRNWLSFLAGDKVSLEGFKELYISRVPGSSVEVEHKGKVWVQREKKGNHHIGSGSPQGPHLDLIPSAKILFPNKVTFIGSRS